MSQRHTSFTLLCVLVSLCGATASVHAANPCDALYDAGIKTMQTPHRVYSTSTTHGGKSQTNEAVFTGGVEYLNIHGQWQRSHMTPQVMVEAAQEKLKTHPDTCTRVGEQSVGGEDVSVYKVHNNEMDIDSQLRIFKSNGLVQGQTTASPGGNTREVHYEYDHVQAPAHVR